MADDSQFSNFPDFSLPKRREPTSDYFRPQTSSSPTHWNVGDRILAPWEPDFLYVGRIAEIDNNRAMIEFEDGDAGWVRCDQIRELLVQSGQLVLSRKNMGPTFMPGEIRQVNGDEVLVGFVDGNEEWTNIAGLRIPCQPTGPGAEPTKVESHRAFLKHLQQGDRVWAPWNAGTLFAGTINKIDGDKAHVHFDDGDQGWVMLYQLIPLELVPGLRVMARWKMGASWYPGTIDKVDGKRIHIQFDDGDREWSKPAALAIPCEAMGPDAQPTNGPDARQMNQPYARTVKRPEPGLGRTVNQSSGFPRWVIWIGIIIIVALFRAGCR